MKKSTIFSAIALLLAGALVVSAGVGSAANGKWFQNKEVSTWFENWGKGEDIEIPAEETEDNVEVSALESVNGISLATTLLTSAEYAAAGVAETSDSAYSLSVSVSPQNADNPLVDWHIGWKDGSSSWASGKNISDYLTISTTSDGALTATLECKQPFGEQAIVTIVSRDNTAISASTTVDYRPKVISYSYSMQTSDGTIYRPLSGDPIPLEKDIKNVFDYEFTIGTLSQPSNPGSVSIKLYPLFIYEWLEPKYGDTWGTGYYNNVVTSSTGFDLERKTYGGVDLATLLTPTNWGSVSEYQAPYCYEEIIKDMPNYVSQMPNESYVFSISVTCNGSTQTANCYAKYNSVQSLSVSTASVIF